jgi:hypothetical protein
VTFGDKWRLFHSAIWRLMQPARGCLSGRFLGRVQCSSGAVVPGLYAGVNPVPVGLSAYGRQGPDRSCLLRPTRNPLRTGRVCKRLLWTVQPIRLVSYAYGRG